MYSRILSLATLLLIGAIGSHWTIHSWSNAQEQTIDERTQLLSIDRLKAQLEKSQALYGSNHPTTKSLEVQLEALKEIVERKQNANGVAPSSIDVHQLDDKELRTFVGKLLNRLDQLEKDVQTLKNPKARIELLRD
jgi:hypothetical protein